MFVILFSLFSDDSLSFYECHYPPCCKIETEVTMVKLHFSQSHCLSEHTWLYVLICSQATWVHGPHLFRKPIVVIYLDKHLHLSFIGFLLEGPLFPFAKSLNKMCVIILTLFMCQNSSLQFLQVHTKSGSLRFTENWITNSQVSVSCWLTCSHSKL